MQQVVTVGVIVGMGASMAQELPFLLVPRRYFSDEEERTWLKRLVQRLLLWVSRLLVNTDLNVDLWLVGWLVSWLVGYVAPSPYIL
jgi:hypothetical protein